MFMNAVLSKLVLEELPNFRQILKTPTLFATLAMEETYVTIAKLKMELTTQN